MRTAAEGQGPHSRTSHVKAVRLGIPRRIAAGGAEEQHHLVPLGKGDLVQGHVVGSTTARLADQLPTDRELTVVTHSVNIALSLSARPNLTIMLVGGRLRSRTLATVDAWALHALQETFVDVAFIATNGVSAERGLTTPDSAEAMIKRAAVASARRVVLLADHTKIGNECFTRFAELRDIDTFITDDLSDTATIAEIAQQGPRVVTV